MNIILALIILKCASSIPVGPDESSNAYEGLDYEDDDIEEDTKSDIKNVCEPDKCYINYLKQYGYPTDAKNSDGDLKKGPVESAGALNSDNTATVDALKLYQEFYNLSVTGEMNNETRALMGRKRCGLEDSAAVAFNLHAYKWENKRTLTWYFTLADHKMRECARRAFAIWGSVKRLRFIENQTAPNILITMSRRVHTNGNENCRYNLDGVFNTLAHAFIPKPGKDQLEIHMDIEESWYVELVGKANYSQTSLLATLTHEIGHTLGLEHSNNEFSVMYPYYSFAGDVKEFALVSDDKRAIMKLYPKMEKTTHPQKPPTTIHTGPAVTTPAAITPTTPVVSIVPVSSSINPRGHENPPDLCALSDELNTFLIINNNDNIIKPPVLISDRIVFLRIMDISKIDWVCQQPDGKILVGVDGVH